MSIIYDTLNRLEMDSSTRADNLDKASARSMAVKSMRFPMKALVTIMMLFFLGTGLIFWHWNGPLGGFNGLSLANATSQTMVGRKPDHQLSSMPVGRQTPPQTQPAVPNSGTAKSAGQPAAPLVQRSLEVAPEIGGQPTKANKRSFESGSDEKKLDLSSGKPVVAKAPTPKSMSELVASDNHPTKGHQVSLQAQSSEETIIVADVKLSMIDTPTAKPKSVLAVPHKQQGKTQVAPLDKAAQMNTVDQAVERARIVLSRGEYQQALTALETLSPVPERRVDFWLLKGSAHLGLGQFDSAEKALASAQLLAPANAQIAVQRAILNQEKGDHASALQILSNAATHNPNVPEVFLNQGYSQQALGAVRNARHSFRIFLRITEGRSLYAEQRKAIKEWLAQFSSASN